MSRGQERSLADGGPAEVQHTGGQEDEDPRVNDGVDGNEAQGNEVQAVRLHPGPDGVDVDPDLRQGERVRGKNERGKRLAAKV